MATRSLARAQVLYALYLIVSGLWPLVHMRSFEAVTGPKRDDWLVRMVGLLAASIGLAVAADAREANEASRAGRSEATPLDVLVATSGLAFAAVDTVYVARRRIRPIYLADAAAQLAFLTARFVAPRRRST